MILGIDEVGRGPWAGPLVVGAVCLNGAIIDGLTDSKKLSKKKRERLSTEILDSNACVGLGWVHADELDEIGLSQSLVEASKRAITQIDVPFHKIIIDGTVNFLTDISLGQYVTTMKKADLLISSVSAASIVAKVARDEFMELQDTLYPGYGFGNHAGYGTVMHAAALKKFGASPLHRRSFAPLKAVETNNTPPTMQKNTTCIGNIGEDAACSYLIQRGFEIIERNWKTKFCEIDIIALKDNKYCYVKVTHRKNALSGDGLAAITPKEVRQMMFAVRMYEQFNRITEAQRLLAVATIGAPAEVVSYVEIA